MGRRTLSQSPKPCLDQLGRLFYPRRLNDACQQVRHQSKRNLHFVHQIPSVIAALRPVRHNNSQNDRLHLHDQKCPLARKKLALPILADTQKQSFLADVLLLTAVPMFQLERIGNDRHNQTSTIPFWVIISSKTGNVKIWVRSLDEKDHVQMFQKGAYFRKLFRGMYFHDFEGVYVDFGKGGELLDADCPSHGTPAAMHCICFRSGGSRILFRQEAMGYRASASGTFLHRLKDGSPELSSGCPCPAPQTPRRQCHRIATSAAKQKAPSRSRCPIRLASYAPRPIPEPTSPAHAWP